MKKYKVQLLIIVALTLSATFYPATATAALELDEVKEVEVVLTDNNKNDTFARVAIIDEINSYSDVWVDGDTPADFVYKNKNNGTIGTVSVNDEQNYPYYINQIGLTDDDSIENPWNRVNWMYVDNIDPLSENGGNITLSMKKNELGKLSSGNEKQFEIDFPATQRNEIKLSVSSSGFYAIFYEPGSISGFNIVSPSNQIIPTIFGSLPQYGPDTPGSIGSFRYFAAKETGTYLFNFISSKDLITVSFEKFAKESKVSMDKQVIYQDLAIDEINPSNLQGESDGLPVQVFPVSIKENSVYRFNFDLIWGDNSLPIMLYMPTPSGYKTHTINPNPDYDVTGDDNFFVSSGSGTAYLVVVNQNYFSWENNIPVRNILKYQFKFTKFDEFIELQNGVVNQINVSAVPGVEYVKFEIEEKSMLYMSAVKGLNNPSFTFIDGDKDNALSYYNENSGLETVDCLAEHDETGIYLLQPGIYYSSIIHPGSTQNKATLNITINIKSLKEIVNTLPLSKAVTNINPADMTKIEFGNIEIDPSIDGSDMMPKLIEVPLTGDVHNLHFYINLTRASNIFEDKDMRFSTFSALYQESKFNDLELTTLVDEETLPFTNDDGESGTEIRDEIAKDVDSNTWLKTPEAAYLIVWPYDVRFDNDTSPDDIAFTQNITFNIAFSEETSNYLVINQDQLNISIVDAPVPEPFPWDTYNNYSISGSFDSEIHDGVLIRFNNSRQYDWYQFILNLNNAADTGADVFELFYDNIWEDNSGPVTSNFDVLSTSTLNYTREIGIAAENFAIFIRAVNSSVATNVTFNLAVNRYDIPILNYVDYESSPGFLANLPTWAKIAAGVVGIALIGTIVVVVVKKKKSL